VLIRLFADLQLPLSGKIPFGGELTPVAVVAMDHCFGWTTLPGPKSVKDFIAAAKAASSPFKMGRQNRFQAAKTTC